MICVFLVHEDFTAASHGALINQNYRFLCEMFEDCEVEFFYHLKINLPERHFIVRIKQAEPERFHEAMQIFAENMCFPMLNYNQKKAFLNRTEPLDNYV